MAIRTGPYKDLSPILNITALIRQTDELRCIPVADDQFIFADVDTQGDLRDEFCHNDLRG